MKIGKLRISAQRLTAYAITLLPFLALLILGLVWLWQHHLSWTLAVALFGCIALGAIAHRWLDHRERSRLHLPESQADPNWPDAQKVAWSKINAFASSLESADWPLSESNKLLGLGRQTIQMVATHYYPDQEQPMLELSVPHLLRIVELAARDLGKELRENVPFSHQLSIGDLLFAGRWKARISTASDWWRFVRPFVNPATVVLDEVRGYLLAKAWSPIQSQVQQWLLTEYVRRVGRYAIEVYGGTVRFAEEDAVPLVAIPRDEKLILKPLEVLILGQTSAGKSSLVNALFGEDRAIADSLPATSVFTRYWLEKEGKLPVSIQDSPGLDTVPRDQLVAAAAEADLILWVIPAHRADRSADRQALDAIRADAATHPERYPTPVVTVLSNIDRLPPRDEWQPPYDPTSLASTKSRHIADAMSAVVADLGITADRIVPVCLEKSRTYNIDEALWPALMRTEEEASRVRLVRCLIEARRAERNSLVLQQLKQLGSHVAGLPGKALDTITSR